MKLNIPELADGEIYIGAIGDAAGNLYHVILLPGDNATPIDAPEQVSRNEWIKWAEAAWTDIRETNTLNVREGRGEDDTKHICPLQLDVIDRLIRLYSLPGEIVFSPFTGIGSEGYTALMNGRRFYGCELKPEYHAAATKNLTRAMESRKQAQADLFAVT